MKKILLTILLIIVVAGVSGGGVYLWQKNIVSKLIFGKEKIIEGMVNGKEKDAVQEDALIRDIEPTGSTEGATGVLKEEDGRSISEEDLVGVYDLEGYLLIEHNVCEPGNPFCDKDWDYAFFIIKKSNSDLIYKFLGDGNSYLRGDGIGLGCYNDRAISSYNRSAIETNGGITQNLINNSDFNRLVKSNFANLVKLQVEIPRPTGGSGASNCYSHFINFKVLN